MNKTAQVAKARPIPILAGHSGIAAKLSKNMALSLARLAVNSLVALVLPAYLVHRLPVTTYGAWVLILQLGAFVSYLDFGVQTGVSKFVAEHEARNDEATAGRYASAGLAIMTLTGLLGVALTLALAWQVPRLFHSMPAILYRDVRISVALVGSSLSFGLVCSVYSAVFLGLQRFAVPMGIAILNRSVYTLAILIAVLLHGSLASMGAAVAAVNIITGLLQVIAWRRMASRIRVSFASVKFSVLKEMTSYCFLLAIWSVGMVCVSGLDITIVGHYDYGQTAFYSIATLPANFILLILSSVFGPMMPASSALSTQRSAIEMGEFLAQITRYCTILLLLTGLPLLVFGYPILHLWVSPVYALSSITYLRILVLANIIRSVCQPYATLLAATGRQGAATITVMSEALVNLGGSVYLARHFGAIGVAYGTLLGSFISVSLHFAISMHFTHQTLTISRVRLLIKGLARPTIIAIPSILFLPLWSTSAQRTLGLNTSVVWGSATLLLAWYGSLNRDERNTIIHAVKKQLMLPLTTS